MQKLSVTSAIKVGDKQMFTLTNDKLDITIHVKDPKINFPLKAGEKVNISNVLKFSTK